MSYASALFLVQLHDVITVVALKTNYSAIKKQLMPMCQAQIESQTVIQTAEFIVGIEAIIIKKCKIAEESAIAVDIKYVKHMTTLNIFPTFVGARCNFLLVAEVVIKVKATENTFLLIFLQN